MTAGQVSERSAPRYKVNLSEQIACCEANYARLLLLMPEFECLNEWQYSVQAGSKAWWIRLRITERARYTTMLEVHQDEELKLWGDAPKLQIRLYHDARLAEVIAWHQHRQLQPRYKYPNRKMYQQDEKAQINRFLSDWLIHSQAHGQIGKAVGLQGILPSE